MEELTVTTPVRQDKSHAHLVTHNRWKATFETRRNSTDGQGRRRDLNHRRPDQQHSSGMPTSEHTHITHKGML